MIPPINPHTSRATTSRPSSPATEQDNPRPPDTDPQQPGADGFAAAQSTLRSILTTAQHSSRRRQHQEEESEAGAAKRTRSPSPTAIEEAKAQLVRTCLRKRLEVENTLFKLINKCPDAEKLQFIEKLIHYFSNISEVVTDTATITNILDHKSSARTKLFIAAFVNFSDDEIKQVASSPFIRSVSAMCHTQGFPRPGAVAELLATESLKINGVTDPCVVSCISSMCRDKGVPSQESVTSLLTLPILCYEGEVNLQLLRPIASICSGRGIPSNEDVVALLALPMLYHRGQINPQPLRSIGAICHGKGMPDHNAVQEFLSLGSLQFGGQPDPEMLEAISIITASKGLPALDRTDALLKLTQLFGNGNFARQTRLLKCFAALYRHRDMPAIKEIVKLLTLPNLQTSGGQFNLPLLERVATSHRGNGFPGSNLIEQCRRQPTFQSILDPLAFIVPGNIHAVIAGLGIEYDPNIDGSSQPATSSASLAATNSSTSSLQSLLASSPWERIRRTGGSDQQLPGTSGQIGSDLQQASATMEEQPSTSGYQPRLADSLSHGSTAHSQSPSGPTSPELGMWVDRVFSWADEAFLAGSSTNASQGLADTDTSVQTALSAAEEEMLDLIGEVIAEDAARAAPATSLSEEESLYLDLVTEFIAADTADHG